MKTEYFYQQENGMLWIALILISAVCILALALIFTVLWREKLTPLNDQIDLMGQHIKRIEEKNRDLKKLLTKVYHEECEHSNHELFLDIKSAIDK